MNVGADNDGSRRCDDPSTLVVPGNIGGPCLSYTVLMSDAGGDGWGGNVLYIDHATVSTTLPSGTSDTSSVCLAPGVYHPLCCGGENASEVSWAIVGNGQHINGTACTADALYDPATGPIVGASTCPDFSCGAQSIVVPGGTGACQDFTVRYYDTVSPSPLFCAKKSHQYLDLADALLTFTHTVRQRLD